MNRNVEKNTNPQAASLKLSICVVSFNQERYIGKCLQSIFNQATDFDFDYEIVVGDDCSSDGTREIIAEFERVYPGRMAVLSYEKNIGALANYKKVHAAAKGEYVAHVDGDDYCLAGKLKKQLEFLESNGDCHLVAHRMLVGDDAGYWSETRKNPTFFGLNYLMIHHPCFLNSSIMYRQANAEDLFQGRSLFIDFYVYVHFASRGKIGFIDESLGYYRAGIGISSRRNLMPYIQMAIDLAEKKMGKHADIARCRAKNYLSYAVADLMAGDFIGFKKGLAFARQQDPSWFFLRGFSGLRFFPSLAKSMIGFYKNKRKVKYVPAP